MLSGCRIRQGADTREVILFIFWSHAARQAKNLCIIRSKFMSVASKAVAVLFVDFFCVGRHIGLFLIFWMSLSKRPSAW